jgi:hypothetical protein
MDRQRQLFRLLGAIQAASEVEVTEMGEKVA